MVREKKFLGRNVLADFTVPAVGSKWVLRGSEFVITVGKRPKLGRPTAEEAGLVWIYDDANPTLDSVTLEEFHLRYDPYTAPVVEPVVKAARTARLILHLDPLLLTALNLRAIAMDVSTEEAVIAILVQELAPIMAALKTVGAGAVGAGAVNV